ncbi:hypothetical protein [Micromonospora zamorensis]|uniref:hypothetical protein n=1 Tax=Micromonospora zamorensis TaxID=709883 RepID=UPI002ED0F754|nr:hypothetical protein OG886_10155 [Micromonospora zamorensis]
MIKVLVTGAGGMLGRDLLADLRAQPGVIDAVVRHHYEYSRSALKFYLLERNRLVTLLTTYQMRTLVVLAPALLLTEAAMLTKALTGGWARQDSRMALAVAAPGLAAHPPPAAPGRTPSARRRHRRADDRPARSHQRRRPGLGVFNMLAGSYWTLAKPLLKRH